VSVSILPQSRISPLCQQSQNRRLVNLANYDTRLPEVHVARKLYRRDLFSMDPSWENFTLDSGATTSCKSRWTRGARAQDSNYHNRRQCRGESQLIVVPVYVNSMCKWACPIDCAHDQWD
jgi:hypothetical protein